MAAYTIPKSPSFCCGQRQLPPELRISTDRRTPLLKGKG